MATTINDLTNDFGFTFVDEEEVTSKAVKSAKAEVMTMADRVEALMNAIRPFLKNLQANPQQEYLKWPDRANKVKEFERKLEAIADGRKL